MNHPKHFAKIISKCWGVEKSIWLFEFEKISPFSERLICEPTLEYDGENVTFKYFNKTEQQEKQETITVEEFISRIIRHIPDEQFKTIRYYGIYSRRGKRLADKLMEAYLKGQKRRRSSQRKQQRIGWRNKLKEFTGKDPLECSRCHEIMEYKGQVSLKSGILVVTHAIDNFARKRLRELAGIDEPSKQKKKETQKEKATQNGWQGSNQVCLFAV